MHSKLFRNLDYCKSLILLVPKEGVEPSWPQGPRDFESAPKPLTIAANRDRRAVFQ